MSTGDESKPAGQQPAFVHELPSKKQVDNIPGTKIRYPSEAYKLFRDAYTYRVSELIFGSLLASYILGFVSFAAKSNLPQILQSLLISVTFCYLTAAYYVTYHNTILTMPHFYSRGLRFDFFIAITQAILFGLSMIWSCAFLIFLALSLWSVYTRQTIAYTQLAEVFEDATIGTAQGRSEWSMDFLTHRRFRTALETVNPQFDLCLSGWLPIAKSKWIYSSVLLLIGCFVAFGDCILSFLGRLPHLSWCSHIQLSDDGRAWIRVIVDAIILALLLKAVNKVFKDRAAHTFVYELPNYDKKLLLDMAATRVVEQLRDSQ